MKLKLCVRCPHDNNDTKALLYSIANEFQIEDAIYREHHGEIYDIFLLKINGEAEKVEYYLAHLQNSGFDIVFTL